MSLPSGSTAGTRATGANCFSDSSSRQWLRSQPLTGRSWVPLRRATPETTTCWGYLSEVDTPIKRIFIAFAVEDKFARDNLVHQAKDQEHVPFDFTDMSVKEPWESAWKSNCRTKIKGC